MNRTTFTYGSEKYIDNGKGYYFVEKDGKKRRISKDRYEEAYAAYCTFDQSMFDEMTEETTTETAATEEQTAVELEPAKMDNYGGVDCKDCPVEGCKHRNCMRRNPIAVGGLGECPRLKVAAEVKEDKPTKAAKPKKTSKPKTKKVPEGGFEFDNDGAKIILTAKQVDFLKHLPDTDFWEHGVDSEIWTDCLCDDIGGQFKGKPMTVGAMLSTICEKGLGTRYKQKTNGKRVTVFHLTDLGQKVAIALGL